MDKIKIRRIDVSDLKKARKFAATGMLLNRYVNNSFELYLYSKYVLYLELSKSTLALGAYMGKQLVGFLFAQFENEAAAIHSWRQQLFVSIGSSVIQLSGHNENSTAYDKANREMFQAFSKQKYDGEITFFAVDPELNGKGIGTLLLEELRAQKSGKTIYLYTDSGSTYQFYLHRGFEIFKQKKITINTVKKELELTCFLMSKRL